MIGDHRDFHDQQRSRIRGDVEFIDIEPKFYTVDEIAMALIDIYKSVDSHKIDEEEVLRAALYHMNKMKKIEF